MSVCFVEKALVVIVLISHKLLELFTNNGFRLVVISSYSNSTDCFLFPSYNDFCGYSLAEPIFVWMHRGINSSH